MTRFPHDQFAKQYLGFLLAPLGEVQTPREVSGEVRQIDVWFAPTPQSSADPQVLGLLGRFAESPCLLEPFRNAPTPTEIRNCLLKLFELHGELQRKARRDEQRLQETDLPRLWILSPSASVALLDGFRAIFDQNWSPGVYFLGESLRTAVVAINQLPQTRETLWLRILGRGAIQQQAISELMALPRENPLRSNALELLANLRVNLEASENLAEEDRELIMNLSPLYLERLEEAVQQGIQQGMQQGIQQGMQQGIQQGMQQGIQQGMQQGMQQEKRLMVESMLEVRFGAIDQELSQIVDQLMQLSARDSTQLIIQLSRAEVLARFRS